MTTTAFVSVLISGVLLALTCEFSSAHTPAEADSSSNAVMTLYQLFGDVYDLKYENQIMAEKIEILEEASAEGKVIAEQIEMLEDKLESLNATDEEIIMDQTEKFKTLEENQLLLETAAEAKIMTQAEKIELLEEQLESLETSTKQKITGQAEKIETLEESLESQQTFTIGQANKIEMMAKSIKMLEEKLESLETTEGVKSAFTVILPTEGLTKNTARFMKAITNEGGHYNTTTGIFTCVYPGIYVFALQILNKNNGDYVTCNIRKNKISKSVEALSNDKGGYFSSSTFAVIHLARGDEVDVKCRSIATINQSWSSFSGFLTQADRY